MVLNLESMEIFENWYLNRHKYAKDWKEKTGGKILGYICTYVPEEILYGLNILPIRLFGGHDPRTATLSDAHIYNAMFCPYCRDCLSLGLAGKYGYIDGLLTAQSCLHMRQVFHIWKYNVPLEFAHSLAMPHGIQSEGAVKHFYNELLYFKEKLENWLNRKISHDEIKEGVKIVNENRKLLRKVYDLRKSNSPPIYGYEALYIVITSQFVDKREHNIAIKKLLDEISKSDRAIKPESRIFVIGSEDDEVDFFRRLEEDLGLVVVIDEQCTGIRYFWGMVKEEDDILMSLAKRYIDRPPCPAKDWPDHLRFDFILDLAKEWKVDGALLIQQKFCMPHELDMPGIKKILEKINVKTYNLEFDITVPWGQFQTRMEAFKEELIGLDELLL